MNYSPVSELIRCDTYHNAVVQDDTLVARGLVALFAWKKGESALLWDNMTPLKMDRTDYPAAVASGVAATMFVSTKKGPYHYHAYDLTSGDALWNTKLNIKASKTEMHVTPDSVVAVGYNHKTKKNELIRLSLTDGSVLSTIGAPPPERLFKVGDNLFLTGWNGVFRLDGDTFENIQPDKALTAVASPSHLYTFSRPKLEKTHTFRSWDSKGNLLSENVVEEMSPCSMLVLDESRIWMSLDPSNGPGVFDCKKGEFRWRAEGRDRRISQPCRLGDYVLARVACQNEPVSLEAWHIETGEHFIVEDLPFFHRVDVVDDLVILCMSEGLQSFKLELPV